MYDQKGRAPESKSQLRVSGTKTYPTGPKCGMNYYGECLAGIEGCFWCGQAGNRLRDCTCRHGQGGFNGKSHSITSAATISHPTQQGN